MKKFLISFVAVIGIMALTGCEFAEGVSDEFGRKAVDIFVEIDDDTMTNELSDRDDVSNFDLLTVEANHKREVAAVKSIEGMLKLQDKVVKGDRDALKEYLQARKGFFKAMGLDDESHRIEHDIPEFQFYEEE